MAESTPHVFNGDYAGSELDRISFPLGGFGAGMVGLQGNGSLGSFSIRGRSEYYHDPLIFAAISIKGATHNVARLIEGPVAPWKLIFPWAPMYGGSGNGVGGKTYGLPRFENASFSPRFPFATVALSDPALPITAEITGWSPFTPGNADDSSLPAAGMEYTFTNRSSVPVEAVYSFHSRNFTNEGSLEKLPKEKRPPCGVRRGERGFILFQDGSEESPWLNCSFAISTDAPGATFDCRWFRGGWFDATTVVWNNIKHAQTPDSPPYTEGDPSPGGSLYVPLKLAPGESKTIRLMLGWYTPQTTERDGKGINDVPDKPAADCDCGPAGCAPTPPKGHRPWYAKRFANVEAVDTYWRQNYDRLRSETQLFSNTFYDTTLPPEVTEAIAANLTILKSCTTQRQEDGRAWLWEGCFDNGGCCHGSCTHVWNYAQALCHLFPDLERSLRESEYHESQDEQGHQAFRTPLPIRPVVHTFHAAADGQLGGIMKAYREWRTSGDTAWLQRIWPKVKLSLDYCVASWDPDHEGILKEPHHNTYDIEFWGPDGMCGSFYAGALKAATLIGKAFGEPTPLYDELYQKAKHALENDLYDGEYFIQKIRWKDLRAPSPVATAAGAQWNVNYSQEAAELMEHEGPKYQYGTGCLSDGVLGAWIAEACGLGEILDRAKITSHLKAIFKYNFRSDLSTHANPQRPAYAIGKEAGLLLCSWPKGGALTLPFVYSDEVWTGIEYQVASHLMMMGCVKEGLKIVRAARSRYDGRIRNPFSEIECGHWYGRALASYGLLQGLTGQRYDAVDKVLYLKPQIAGDFRSFISTATGYGTVGVRGGKPFLEVKHGSIPVERIEVLSR